MKFLFALVAVFGLAYCDTTCTALNCAHPTELLSSPNLLDEFKKFAALIPVSEIEKVALTYISNDEEVQEVLAYLQSKDFANVVLVVESQKEVIDLYASMCKSGLNVYKYLNSLHDLLGIAHVTPAPTRDISPSTRTFRQFLDDMEKLIPIAKLRALFIQEEKDSTVWKAWVDRISSKEFRAMVDKMIALPEVKKFAANLEKLGVDINQLNNFVRELLGWSTN